MDNDIKSRDGQYLTNRAAYNILNMFAHDFNSRYANYNYGFELDAGLSVRSGVSQDFGHYGHAIIGVNEIARSSNEPVHANQFMFALVGLFHEKRHVDHMVKIFHENSLDAQCLAVNYYACAASPDGYYQQNYWTNPREVDAQFAGIVGAYKYCRKAFGEQEAERLICGYVNERIARNSEFVEYKDGQPYHNFDDIVDAFDEAFQNAKHCHRDYNPEDAKVVRQKIDGSKEILPDDSAKFFDRIEKSKSLKSICDQFDSRSGYEQDRILATAYFTERPEMRHLLNECTALKKADLTVPGLCKSFSIPMSVKDKFQRRRDPTVVFDDVLTAVEYDVSDDTDYGDG